MTSSIEQTGSETLDFTDPNVIASHLELAAAHIKAFGKVAGEWWNVIDAATGLPGLLMDYQDGRPTDVLGAIALQLGYRSNIEVFGIVCGLDDEYLPVEVPIEHERRDPHPVVGALMRELGYAKVESLFAWSDAMRDDQVVDRLREVATVLRERVVA